MRSIDPQDNNILITLERLLVPNVPIRLVATISAAGLGALAGTGLYIVGLGTEKIIYKIFAAPFLLTSLISIVASGALYTQHIKEKTTRREVALV